MGTFGLGWGWLSASWFDGLIGLLGLVITLSASVVSWRAARRGLYVSAVVVDRIWGLQPASGSGARPSGPGTGSDPHQMVVRFTYRGGVAIGTDAFGNGADLAFDVGAGIIKLVERRAEPRDAPTPEFRVQGESLLLPPTMINPGTSVYASLVLEGPPARPISCTGAVLANVTVRVRRVEDADTAARACRVSLAGAGVSAAVLLVRRAVPAFAAKAHYGMPYRVIAILACVVALAVIMAAVIGKPRPPRLAAGLSGAVALGVAASIALLAAVPAGAAPALSRVRPPIPAALSCPEFGDGHWSTTYSAPGVPGDRETVGYSSSAARFFVNQGSGPGGQGFPGEDAAQKEQDARVYYDEQRLFAGNCQADRDYQGDPVRPLVELVYFAGITEGINEDYDSGEAEELEGLLAAQLNSLTAGSGPLLKIIIANGGAQMGDAVPVARQLVKLAAGDPYLLGVVGMDRSITGVKTAIQLFAHNGIPVVATTLSADGIGRGASPYYFQLTPSNSSEATLIRQYIQQVVPSYFKLPKRLYASDGSPVAKRIVIFEPDVDPDDLYTSTMVSDLKAQPWQSDHLPEPQVIYRNPTQALCGDATVDIYAGRHDEAPGSKPSYGNEFTQFLSYVGQSCQEANQPFIIGDDGVTRFVADPAQRTDGSPATGYSDSSGKPLWISYVTKGIAILQTDAACLNGASAASYHGPVRSLFCETYAGIVKDLRQHVPGLQFLWTGERVGLAYDAANLFLTAANRVGQLSRKNVAAQLAEDGPISGVTGTADFTKSPIASSQGMPLAIVRLDLGNVDSTPTCAFPGQPGYIYGPGPWAGTANCPNDRS